MSLIDCDAHTVLMAYWRERSRRENPSGILARDLDMPYEPGARDDTLWIELISLVKGVDDVALRLWRDIRFANKGCIDTEEFVNGVRVGCRRPVSIRVSQVAKAHGMRLPEARRAIERATEQIDDNLWERRVREPRIAPVAIVRRVKYAAPVEQGDALNA